MGRFTDVPPSQQGWIHELARAELHPDAERLLNLSSSVDPQQLVEESTIDFLTALRDQFNEYVRLFNVYSETGARFQEIKIYSVANTAADFMIFRNQIKLMITNAAHGMIQLSFAHHVRNTVAVNGQAPTQSLGAQAGGPGNGVQELLAQVGPFRDVYWTFQGEKVAPEQVAKFYFAEFARVTRASQKSTRAGNQVLLDQIKALLQEKGLNL